MKTYTITGPDADNLYHATCQGEPNFHYTTEVGPERALDGLLWIMRDDSPSQEASSD